jgi:hypothetical protein
MRQHLTLKLAAVLIAAGVVISMLGFAMSGFNPDSYRQYNNSWYSTVHLD